MAKKAITLVELLVGIILLGVIVLAGLSFEVAGHRFFVSSDRKSQAINDVAYILDHIHKYSLYAYGSASDPGFAPNSAGTYDYLELRNNTNGNLTWVRYYFNATGHNVTFCWNWTGSCASSDTEVLSSRITLFNVTPSINATVSCADSMEIDITGRYNASSSETQESQNPKVTMNTRVSFPQNSLN